MYTGKPCCGRDAVKFDTYRNLQRYRVLIPEIARLSCHWLAIKKHKYYCWTNTCYFLTTTCAINLYLTAWLYDMVSYKTRCMCSMLPRQDNLLQDFMALVAMFFIFRIVSYILLYLKTKWSQRSKTTQLYCYTSFLNTFVTDSQCIFTVNCSLVGRRRTFCNAYIVNLEANRSSLWSVDVMFELS